MAYNSEFFPSPAFRNVNTLICAPERKALCFSSKPARREGRKARVAQEATSSGALNSATAKRHRLPPGLLLSASVVVDITSFINARRLVVWAGLARRNRHRCFWLMPTRNRRQQAKAV